MTILKSALFATGLILAASLQAAPPLKHINSDLPEYALVKGPDGWYFSRSTEAFGKPGKEQILMVPLEGGLDVAPEWTDTDYSEGDVYFSPNGNRLCFATDRVHEDDPHPGDTDIWCADSTDGGWIAPRRMPEPVNSPGIEFSPVLAADGSLYFASDREGGAGQGDLYRAVPDGADSWTVEALGPNVNSDQGEWNLELSPDGTLLLFEASGRSTNLSVPGDLYLSRKTSSAWSPGIPLSKLNTTGSELMPRFFSPSELAYASSEGDDADIKVVSADDYMPVSKTLAAVSRSNHEIVLLNPGSLEVRRRIQVGTGSHEIASSLDGRRAIVPSLGVFPKPHEQAITPQEMSWQTASSEGYAVLDLATASIQRLTLDDCLRPHGAAVSAQANRAWFTCEDAGDLLEIDTVTSEVINRLPLGKGVHKVMFLEASGVLVTSNPDTGEVSLIDARSGEATHIATGKGAEALAAARDEKTVWVANAMEASVCRIEVASKSLQGCWPSGGKFPIALAVDESRSLLWVARSASADVAALSLETLESVRVFPLESTPLGMAIDEPGGRLYLTLPRLNQVVMLDVDSGAIMATTSQVMEGDDLDLVPATDFRQAPDT